MSPNARLIVGWTPAAAWAVMIFALSAQPDLRFVPDDGVDFGVRKVGHMGVFGVQALLLWRALAATSTVSRPWAWALAFTVLYAISDEVHQGSVPGRHASAADVVIDAAGAAATVAAVALIRAWARARLG